MADLIDRDALLEKKTVLWDDALGWTECVDIDDIESAPAVDAVEVVRCCKCKHYKLQLTRAESETMCCTINAEYDEDVGVWYGLTSYPPPEFYCADGERRTDATD